MNEYMKLLGMKAEDKVTGLKGVVTSVSFDLYGCVQVVLAPTTDKDGGIPDAHWLDAKRLKVIGTKPVMEQPAFASMSAGQEKGPAAKPAMSSRVRQ